MEIHLAAMQKYHRANNFQKKRGCFPVHFVKRLRRGYALPVRETMQEPFPGGTGRDFPATFREIPSLMRMLNNRVLLLAGVAALLAVVMIWKWVAGWGYVTVNVHDAPLAKVIESIESQGGVKIRTNADPATPVTMLVERVPAYEAIDTLAIAIDGDARLAYVAAPSDRQIKDVLAAFSGGNNPGGWAVFSGGFGGRGGGGGRDQAGGQAREPGTPRPERTAEPQQAGPNRDQGGGGGFGGGWVPTGDTLTDPRVIVWAPSDSEDKSLQAILNQGSQKTGALFAVPQDWNPVVGKLPGEGRTGKVTVSIVKSAKGSVQELFLLTVQPPRPQTAGNDAEVTRTVFAPQRGGQRNAEWMAERVRAQIAALPPEQRADAQKQMDEMRAFWESVRNLPEEERRAKMEEMMNRPEVQERMEERMNARDAKSPPQKREDRMRRYLDRKNQMKGNSSKS